MQALASAAHRSRNGAWDMKASAPEGLQHARLLFRPARASRWKEPRGSENHSTGLVGATGFTGGFCPCLPSFFFISNSVPSSALM